MRASARRGPSVLGRRPFTDCFGHSSASLLLPHKRMIPGDNPQETLFKSLSLSSSGPLGRRGRRNDSIKYNLRLCVSHRFTPISCCFLSIYCSESAQKQVQTHISLVFPSFLVFFHTFRSSASSAKTTNSVVLCARAAEPFLSFPSTHVGPIALRSRTTCQNCLQAGMVPITDY